MNQHKVHDTHLKRDLGHEKSKCKALILLKQMFCLCMLPLWAGLTHNPLLSHTLLFDLEREAMKKTFNSQEYEEPVWLQNICLWEAYLNYIVKWVYIKEAPQ